MSAALQVDVAKHETPAAAPLFELRGICKEFPGVKALDDVSFAVWPGEVHMLLGENGAGKSSLMKVLCGAYRADRGEFYYKGEQGRDHVHGGCPEARHCRDLPGILAGSLSRHRPEHLSRPRAGGAYSRQRIDRRRILSDAQKSCR